MNKRVNKSMSTAVRQFAFFVANKTVGYPILNNTDYSNIINEASALEMTFAIFMNNLELDIDGNVFNTDYAGKRAAQYIKSYFDINYKVDPPFEEFELILHAPN